MHLAQINVARARGPMDSAVMAEFVAQLDAVNALAEASPGFVWRLVGDGNDATSIRAFADPLVLVNMSVWTSVEALHAFVYRSRHARVMRSRADWFEKFDGPYYALWWVPEGHRPTVEEGVERLEHLRRHGPSDRAFWFGRPSPAGGSIMEA